MLTRKGLLIRCAILVLDSATEGLLTKIYSTGIQHVSSERRGHAYRDERVTNKAD